MSVLEELKAENARRQCSVDARGQLLSLARYFEAMLEAQRVDFRIDRRDEEELVFTVSLVPPKLIEPPVLAPAAIEPATAPRPAKARPGKPEKAKPEKIVKGRYSEDEIRIIHQMLDEGAVGSAIAAKLGRDLKLFTPALARIRSRWKKVRRQEAEAAGAAEQPEQPVVCDPPDVLTPDPAISAPSPAPSMPVAGGGALPFDDSAPLEERLIEAHLNAVGYVAPWDAQLDCQLVSGILAGHRLDILAIEHDVEYGAAKSRWQMLNRQPGDLDHQALLIKVLRRRADA